MINVQIEVQNLNKLRSNFRKSPATTLKYLAKATSASIFEVEKQAIDANFRFKTPRSRRSGQLAQSFSHGRKISNSGLQGSIGPTVRYAPYVYFGTSRGLRPNRYMDRIAKAATPAIERHFERAVDLIANKLAKV